MKRRFALAFGVLSMGLCAGTAAAADPIPPQRIVTGTMVIADAPGGKNGAPAPVINNGDLNCNHGGCGSDCYGGIGIYYIRPVYDSAPAYSQGGVGGSSVHHLDWDLDFAPRIFGGINLCDGLSVRASYWMFDQSSNEVQVAGPATIGTGFNTLGVPAGGSGLGAAGIDLQVFDVEIVKTCSPCCGIEVVLSSGLRWADLGQHFDAADQTSGISLNNMFRGFGPTVGAEVRYGIGCGCAAYGSARGSLLYGHSKQTVGSISPGTGFMSTSELDDIMPIGELEVGVMCCHEACGSHFFAQFGIVRQVWDNAGSPVTLPADPFGSGAGNLGFAGINITLGVQR